MLKCFIGCMFAGKTSAMINEIEKANIAGIKTLIIKYEGDNRYCPSTESKLITHNKKEYDGKVLSAFNLCDIDDYITSAKIQVIGIDEYQFFDGEMYPVKWVNSGCDVYISALDGDYKQKIFENITYILPYCDEIIKLKAVCMKCFKRNSAIFSHRISQNTNRILVGANDEYLAICRNCYLA